MKRSALFTRDADLRRWPLLMLLVFAAFLLSAPAPFASVVLADDDSSDDSSDDDSSDDLSLHRQRSNASKGNLVGTGCRDKSLESPVEDESTTRKGLQSGPASTTLVR